MPKRKARSKNFGIAVLLLGICAALGLAILVFYLTGCSAEGIPDPTTTTASTTTTTGSGATTTTTVVTTTTITTTTTTITTTTTTTTTTTLPPGSLDVGFGVNGWMTVGSFLPGESSDLWAAASGSILLGGRTDNAMSSNFALAKLTDAGALDGGFGSGGRIEGSAYGHTCTEIIERSDNKVLTVGSDLFSSPQQPQINRFNSDGSPDTAFGSGGKYVRSFGGPSANAYGVGIGQLADGKLIIGGDYYDTIGASYDFYLMKLEEDGSGLDASFGTAGIAATSSGGTADDYLNSLLTQADGRIISCGYTNDSPNTIFLTRHTAGGLPDNTFDSDGQVNIGLPGTDSVGNKIIRQTDGKYLVGGYANLPGGSDILVARVNADGSLDTSFDTDGFVTIDFSGAGTTHDVGQDIVLQPDGKILVGSRIRTTGDEYYAVLSRLNSDGSIDATFNDSGPQPGHVFPITPLQQSYSLSANPQVRLLLSAGQKVLVATIIMVDTNHHLGVFRYWW